MCKNLIITNTSKLTNRDFLKLLKLSSTVLTKNDSHGFGYAALGEKGIFGERFLDTDSIHLPLITKKESKMPKSFESIFASSECDSFGTPSKLSGGLLIHARYSTNTISLVNTHPHRTDAWTLIHNGVVSNEGKSFEYKSTCDSEYLVQHLTDSGVHGMVSNVRGYYAIGAIEHSTGKLLVVKDSKASLFACYVTTIESLVFSTCDKQLSRILKGMKWRHESIGEVKSNVALTFDKKGELLSQEEIKPLESIRSISLSESYLEKEYDKSTKEGFDWGSLREPIDYSYDYMKEEEYSHPNDERYAITDPYGNEISYASYKLLSAEERERCSCVERASGYVVGRYGY